ncbi:MAG: hypothetical protein IPI38_12850 [Gemmatimonadetes bacterium]|nr:hypothetical protein [Gemmatimonadota bacterium]MBK7785601.1 hypothetical protein [Gemmatimonadota bacterium]
MNAASSTYAVRPAQPTIRLGALMACMLLACSRAASRGGAQVDSSTPAPEELAVAETARQIRSSLLKLDLAGGGRLTMSPVAGRYSPGDSRRERVPRSHAEGLVQQLVERGIVRGTCMERYLWSCADTGARYFLWIASPSWLAPDTLGVQAKVTEMPWPWRTADAPGGLLRREYLLRFVYAEAEVHLTLLEERPITE